MIVASPRSCYPTPRSTGWTYDARTLGEVLLELDRRYPGLRFRIVDEQDRIRRHIHIFINKEMTSGLDQPLAPADEIRIIGAISGG